MEESAKIIVPSLFMSANWFSEKMMTELFLAGLQSGVRGFDTAREYGVEKMVGRALKCALRYAGISRNEVFIQSRVSNEEIIKGKIYNEVCQSLEKMKLDYFDCFMFHWPTPLYWITAWRSLEETFDGQGILRSIGLCNCRIRHLKQMEDAGVKYLPHIIQVEVTPLWQNRELKNYCDERNIKIQAFSPLCKMIDPIRESHILQKLSNRHHVSIPQLILKWHQQRGISPISMTSKVSRVKENFNLSCFQLTTTEMDEMATIDCGYKYHLESATCVGF